MRRAPIVLTTTVAGTVGLLGFQAREPALPTAAAATAPAPTAPTPAPVSPPPAAGAGTASISGTFDGEAVDTRYGAAQVRVTLADGKITEIEALQLQGNERKSVEISSRAAPELRVSALSAQSAVFDAVSGATITSASYAASLQSALDQAGFASADGQRASSVIPQVEERGGRSGEGFPGAPPGG